MVATIKDVAREASVDISTVSRALNNAYGVHEQTRNHVIAVATRLGYQPNRVARSLVTGRSHSLALVVSDIRNPFFAEVARGAGRCSARQRLRSDSLQQRFQRRQANAIRSLFARKTY